MKLTKIKIIHPVPSFVCPIISIEVPPLARGETIELPEEVANLLIRKCRAVEIIIENPFEKFE